MLPRRHTRRRTPYHGPPVRTDQLDYELPDALIATQPATPRDTARLMVVRRDTGDIEHHQVRDLPGLGVLRPNDLILVNQTRVLPAYLVGRRASTGGRITGLYLASQDANRWQVMLESRGTLAPGESITLGEDGAGDALELLERLGDGQWLVQLHSDDDTPVVLERVGQTPLPPYIRKQRRRLGVEELSESDTERYNTVFAGPAGSVAAPTAGLHFTPDLLSELERMGVGRAAVELRVGIGTFAPVRSDTLQGHRMHDEWFTVPGPTLRAIRKAREADGRLMIVGTTTVRALESLPPDALDPGAYPDGVTDTTGLFIHPQAEFTFRFTDRLMTNFHLPRSTLLALVAALPGVGPGRLMGAYRQAVDQQYRFYSYGDAMLVV